MRSWLGLRARQATVPVAAYLGNFPFLVKSIQQGSMTMGSGGVSATAAISAVVVANSIVLSQGITSNGATANRSSVEARFSITSTTQVTGNKAGSGTTVTGQFVVIEFAAGILKSNQVGTITIAPASVTNTAAISSVDTTKAVLICQGQNPSAPTDEFLSHQMTRLTLTSATVVTATRISSTDAVTIAYCVAEFY